ncbi:MAG: TonB-dependent receptor [Pedobacter sp.]|jgi:iron complex outermembrane receptor protein
MKASLKILLPLSILIISGYSVAAQAVQDTVFRHLILKEVQIQGYTQSKHPGSAFYQSSSLSGTEDILSRIEGVSLIRRGPIGMEPVLRAFSAGQINVVIDGMKFFGACTDKMDPVTIYTEPVNLKSIDIKYAGDGMAMGSAIGGSLNLKLAEAMINPEKKFSGTIASGFYSAAAAIQNILALDYSSAKWAMRISGVYRKAGDYRDGLSRKVDFSQYEKANVSISTKYQLNKSSSLKADVLIDDGWNIGYPALPMDVGHAGARVGAITYRNNPAEGLIKDLETKVYVNSIRHTMDDTRRPFVPIHMDMPGWSDTQGAYIQTQLRSRRKHSISMKLDSYHNRVKADMTMYPANSAPMYMLTWPLNHQTVTGLFVQDLISLNDKSRIDFKVRMDAAFSKVADKMGQDQFAVLGYDVSKPENGLLKNISAGYTRYLDSEFTFYASAGYAERLPSTSERYGFYLFNRMDNHDYLGNPNLKNEQAINAELNIIYSGNNISLKLSGFTSLMQQYIIGQTQAGLSVMTIGADGVRAYNNISSARISGAESSLNYQFANPHFLFNNTLKWVLGRDNTGNPLPLIAPLKSVSGLRFTHQNLFIQAENEISAGQQKISSAFGEKPSPGFSIVNIRATYTFKFKNSNLEFSAGAENLLDKAYYEHLDWGKMLRPGRNIYTMLSMKF